jgi:hypothetical protein
LIDILPVLDAQRSALIAQLSLAESQTDLLTSLVAVFKAVGGGWDDAIVEVETKSEKEPSATHHASSNRGPIEPEEVSMKGSRE